MTPDARLSNAFSRLFKGTAVVFVVLAAVFLAAFLVFPLPGRVPVLMYHFIRHPTPQEDSGNILTPESFSRQMQFLNRFGYRVISLDELYEIRTGKRKPRGREIAMTFDDGNYTFETTAYPVLAKYAFPVTIFVVSENVKNQLHGSMGTESLQSLLTTGWVRLGAHSRTHPYLSKLNLIELRRELTESRQELEAAFEMPLQDLAYPYGDFNETVLREAQAAGYRQAFTTAPDKKGTIPEGLFATSRVKITDSADNLFVFWVKISGIYNAFKEWRHQIKLRKAAS